MQQRLTYGLSRSPIRAHFQNIPKKLFALDLCSSISPSLVEIEGEPGGRVHVPVLVAIHDPGHHGVGVGACADDQEDHQEEGLEVEQG